MANPIMPSGRRRSNISSEDIRPPADGILDLDGDRHTLEGDWVEDNHGVIGGTPSVTQMEEDISRLFGVNMVTDPLNELRDPTQSRVSRETVVDEYNRERQDEESKEKGKLRDLLIKCKEKFNDAISGLEL